MPRERTSVDSSRFNATGRHSERESRSAIICKACSVSDIVAQSAPRYRKINQRESSTIGL